MLHFLSLLLSSFLVIIIFFRLPNESAGLTNFSTTNNFLNLLIFISVLFYLGIAIKLNFLNN